jgi:hypothetical protein
MKRIDFNTLPFELTDLNKELISNLERIHFMSFWDNGETALNYNIEGPEFTITLDLIANKKTYNICKLNMRQSLYFEFTERIVKDINDNLFFVILHALYGELYEAKLK